MAVNWLELAAPNSTVPLDNYALVLNNQFNYTGGMVYEAENTFTVEFMVKPKVAHEIDVESTSGFSGTEGQKYVMFPVQGGSEADSRAGMGISVGTNGVSVYEHADGYMPALLVWEYPIDTVWTHVAVVYHNGKPSLYINGVWKKDGLQSLKQHVYPGTMFPGGYYGSQGDGILDEVRIWSVARTQQQIAANKDGELTGPQTGLVGYWPMNEGTGLVLHDVSGSGRDVDLTSAGYTSASWTNGRYSVASISGSYRYAFNGKELDQDIDQDDYDYGMRISDSRLGRFLSVDPLTKKYPHYTPYSFAGNSPIIFTDLDGAERNYYIYQLNKNNQPVLQQIVTQTHEAGFWNSVADAYKYAGNIEPPYSRRAEYNGDLIVDCSDIYVLQSGLLFKTFSSFSELKATTSDAIAKESSAATEQAVYFLFYSEGAVQFLTAPSPFAEAMQREEADYQFDPKGKEMPGYVPSRKLEKLFAKAEVVANENVTRNGKSLPIGSAELEDGVLITAIYLKHPKTGEYLLKTKTETGSTVFSRLFNEIQAKGGRINTIQGRWTGDDNLKKFNELILEGIKPENAAKMTFTGREAGAKGYKNATIDANQSIKNSDGVTYKKAVVNFNK